MAPRSPCFICDGTVFDQLTRPYRRCVQCGHETLVAPASQTLMLNETLDDAEAKRGSALLRFQGATLDRLVGGGARRVLADIGSGAGAFLFQQRGRFARSYGVEITPAAIAFARKTMGLTVVTSLAEIDGDIDVATAWHSLEHFPAPALTALLRDLGAKMPPGAHLIVSVPNAASFQYRWFRGCDAFFDVANHPHQFTPTSLELLLAAHGFDRRRTVISWPYNIFGYAQGLLNLVMPGHNYAYQRLKRGAPAHSLARDLAALGLLFLAVPLALLGAVVDAICPEKQGVLTCGFERRG